MSALNDINPRVPFVDKDGYLTTYWAKWFQSLYVRTGGDIAPSNTDLAVDLPEDAGMEEMRALLFSHIDATGQEPARIDLILPNDQAPIYQQAPAIESIETQLRALAEQVAAQQREIDGLKQGASA